MKQPRKPTREEKELLVKNGFEPAEWMVTGSDKTKVCLILRKPDVNNSLPSTIQLMKG